MFLEVCIATELWTGNWTGLVTEYAMVVFTLQYLVTTLFRKKKKSAKHALSVFKFHLLLSFHLLYFLQHWEFRDHLHFDRG